MGEVMKMNKLLILILLVAAVVMGQPDSNWTWFNNYCKAEFGAQSDSLYYVKYGTTLRFDDSSFWKYPSLNSTCIAWRTNLPCHSKIRFGTTSEYGDSVIDTLRFFYNHLLYVTGLDPSTEYHYQIVNVDERDSMIESGDSTFTTVAAGLYKTIPDSVAAGPPYICATASTRYILTQDLSVDSIAIEIKANNVELDLNGHTVEYNANHVDFPKPSGTGWDFLYSSPRGVKAIWRTDTKIFNGKIFQGAGNDSAQNQSCGPSPVALVESNTYEIGGVSIGYKGKQLSGFFTDYITGYIHHCVSTDSGTEISNRHQGTDAIKTRHARYNRINRVRHRGISNCSLAVANEIYSDGWAPNNFGIGLFNHHKGVCSYNLVAGIAGTGSAYGWSFSDTLGSQLFLSNIAHLVGDTIETVRDDEYPDMSLRGFRITQYDGETKKWVNWVYDSNIVILNLKGRMTTYKADGRGLNFTSDPYITGCVFKNGIVKVWASDSSIPSSYVRPILPTGTSQRDSSAYPIYYDNVTVISNRGMIQFAEANGASGNHIFRNPTFVRSGPVHGGADNYYSFLGIGYPWVTTTTRNKIINPVYVGSNVDSGVVWLNSTYDYPMDVTLLWSLNLTIKGTQDVKILTVADSVVVDTTVTDTVSFDLPHTKWQQYNLDIDTITYNPYRVIIGGDTTTITVDTIKQLSGGQYFYNGAVGQVIDTAFNVSGNSVSVIVRSPNWKSSHWLLTSETEDGVWSAVDSSIGLVAGTKDTLTSTIGTTYLRVFSKTKK